MATYYDGLNDFFKQNELEPLATSAQIVYLHLLHMNNRNGNGGMVQITDRMLGYRTSLDKSTVTKAKQILKNHGLIDFKTNRNNPRAGTRYTLSFFSGAVGQSVGQNTRQNIGQPPIYSTSTLTLKTKTETEMDIHSFGKTRTRTQGLDNLNLEKGCDVSQKTDNCSQTQNGSQPATTQDNAGYGQLTGSTEDTAASQTNLGGVQPERFVTTSIGANQEKEKENLRVCPNSLPKTADKTADKSTLVPILDDAELEKRVRTASGWDDTVEEWLSRLWVSNNGAPVTAELLSHFQALFTKYGLKWLEGMIREAATSYSGEYRISLRYFKGCVERKLKGGDKNVRVAGQRRSLPARHYPRNQAGASKTADRDGEEPNYTWLQNSQGCR